MSRTASREATPRKANNNSSGGLADVSPVIDVEGDDNGPTTTAQQHAEPEPVYHNTNEPRSLRCARAYLHALHRVKYPMLMTYVVVVVGLAFAAAAFPGDVRTSIEPPRDSAAYQAKQKYQQEFPALQSGSPSFLIARSVSTPIDFTVDLNYLNFDATLQYWCFTGRDPNVTFGFEVPKAAEWVVASYSSYREVVDYGLIGPVADAYIANGGFATEIQVVYNLFYDGPNAISESEFIRQLNDKIELYLAWNGLTGLVEVTPLGVAAFMNDINASTMRDLIVLFGLVTPVALVIFGYTLSSVRIIILPFLSIIATTVMTFAFMHFVALHIDVNSLAPGVAAVVCLALAFSFTYTFAAKFQREALDQLNFGEDRHMIVLELVLAYSGRTVFTSAMCIALCTLGMVFFPIEMLRSIGLSCLFASLSAMVVTLLIIPTILMCAPQFFTNGLHACVWPILFDSNSNTDVVQEANPPPAHARAGSDLPPSSLALGGGGALSDNDGPSVLRRTPRALYTANTASVPEDDYTVSRGSGDADPATRASHRVQRVRYFYKHFIAFLCQLPVASISIVVMLGLCGYPMSQAFGTTYSNDLTQFLPRNSDLLPGWDFMQRTFRAGEVFQYTLVMKFTFLPDRSTFFPMNLTILLNNETFNQGQRAIQMLTDELPMTTGHAFDTFFWNGLEDGPAGRRTRYGGPITQEFFLNCSTANKTGLWWIENAQECLYTGILFELFINQGAGGPYTWVQVRLNFNPLGAQGVEWYHRFLDITPRIEQETGIQMWLSGYPADTIDLVQFATRKFPLVVVLVSIILFVAVCLFCVNLGVPLRGLLIVFVTTMTAFGLGNLVFCHGILNWLPIEGLQGTEGAVAWLMPFATLLLVVGIAAHYDLSIVLRVKQFHHHGHETKAAIILAAQETGSEITVSACMTILLFTGLVFSRIPAMNQLGFYLLIAALLEGIVFRLFLSTTMMSLLGEWNWFPNNLICPTDAVPIEEDPLLFGEDAHHTSFNPYGDVSFSRGYSHMGGRGGGHHHSMSNNSLVPSTIGTAPTGASPPPPVPRSERDALLTGPQQQGSAAGGAGAPSAAGPASRSTSFAHGTGNHQPRGQRGSSRPIAHYGTAED